MPDIKSLTGAELLRLYRKRELSPVEVTRDQLERIDKFEPAINAFIIVDRDGALKAAHASETRWQKGEPLSIADGLGATVKDNIWLKDFPARRGSLTSDPAPMNVDAPAVARLREAGAVILGKTTLPEFGWIGACHSPFTGITRNPWKLDRTTGGSSGGAAAAALLNLGHLHIGTDCASRGARDSVITRSSIRRSRSQRNRLRKCSATSARSSRRPIRDFPTLTS